MNRKFKFLTVTIVLIMMLLTFCGCFPSDGDTYTNGILDDTEFEITDTNDGKIWYKTKKLSYQTTNSVDDFVEKVKATDNVEVKSCSVEGEESTYARLILKVPTSKLSDIVSSLSENNTLVDESLEEIEVTDSVKANNEKISRLKENIAYLEESLTTATGEEKISAMVALEEFRDQLAKISNIERYQADGQFTKVIIEITKVKKQSKAPTIIIYVLFGVVILGVIGANVYKNVMKKKMAQNANDNHNNNQTPPNDDNSNSDFI